MSTIKSLSTTKITIAPSLLAADFANLKKDIQKAEEGGADLLHLDIMDGHFVPNLTMGPPLIQSIRKISNMIFDVHLMLTNPYDYIIPFAKSGADHITFHIECNDDIYKTINLIKENNMTVGLSVRPNTPIEKIFPFLDYIDLVLIMTVEPGFGGQSFMENMIPKIEILKKKIDKHEKSIHIQVDGGINIKTISKTTKHGANMIVAGSSVFGNKEGIKKAITELRKASK